MFPRMQGVIYLGVIVTEKFLNVHTSFHRIFDKRAQEHSDDYTVGKWIPQCTLAFGLSDRQIAEAVLTYRRVPLPILTEVKEIGFMEVSPTSCHTLCLCQLD